jgi:hypothetical protein
MLQICISPRCGDIPERLQSPFRVAAQDALGRPVRPTCASLLSVSGSAKVRHVVLDEGASSRLARVGEEILASAEWQGSC